MWWIKKSIELNKNPYYTEYLFYPNGASLILTSISYNSLIAQPLLYIFDENYYLTYNLLVLLSFVLSALGMYLLAFYLTKDKPASFFAAYIFAFSPYMIGHASGHLTLISLQWIPLFILFFIKFHKIQKIKYIFLCSLFLVLASLTTWYYPILIILFSIVYMAFFMIQKRNTLGKNYFIKVFSIFFLYFLILSPILINILISFSSGNFTSNHNPDYFSADLFTFFVPGSISSQSKFNINPITQTNTYSKIINISHQGVENQNFVGYLVLLLSIYSLIKVKSKKTLFWSISALIYLLMILGTKLKILGFETDIKLPHHFMYKIIPLVSVTSRFMPLFLISVSILSALAISHILKNMKSKKRILFFILFLIIIFVELLSIPFPMTKFEESFFYNKLAKEDENYALLDLSHGFNDGENNYAMYYQTIHNKKIVHGVIARTERKLFNYLENEPVISEMMNNELVTDEFHEKKTKEWSTPIQYISGWYLNENSLNISFNWIKKESSFTTRKSNNMSFMANSGFSDKTQELTIFVDNKEIKKIVLLPYWNRYFVQLPKTEKEKIIITFKLNKIYPKRNYPLDHRDLGLMISDIELFPKQKISSIKDFAQEKLTKLKIKYIILAKNASGELVNSTYGFPLTYEDNLIKVYQVYQ